MLPIRVDDAGPVGSGVSGVSLLHDVKNAAAGCGGTVALLDARWLTVWWSQTGSNRRPPACKAGALPTELWPLLGPTARPCSRLPGTRSRSRLGHRRMVGLERFELSTSRLSSARSNQLSYRPGKRGGRPNEERETKAAVSRKGSRKLALHRPHVFLSAGKERNHDGF